MAEQLFAHVVDCETGEVELVPLDAAECLQLEADRAASLAAIADIEAANAARVELVAKLSAGKASSVEVQTALAEYIGVSSDVAAP